MWIQVLLIISAILCRGFRKERSEEHTSELQSLPESFKEFRLNYNMNKNIYSLSELMNELVVTKGILGTSSVDANMAEASTS